MKFVQFHGRALYNLLQMNWKKDSSIEAEPWQVEDYRALSDNQLFSKLKDLDIFLNIKQLKLEVQRFETPEDLVESLVPNAGKRREKAYLVFFELWRRHFPEKASLSIFCDEIDHFIEKFDRQGEIDSDSISEYLHHLENILDINVDHGMDPKAIFKHVSRYFAHHLERFIYDFISNQLENGNETLSSEILDGFYEYVESRPWFDFLRIKIVALSDVDEASFMLSRLLESLAEKPDVELYIEILHYLNRAGRFELFFALFPVVLELTSIEIEFQQLLIILQEYFHLLARKDEEQAVSYLLKERSKKDLTEPISAQDKHLIGFETLLKK